ncbi:MAG TPA: ATP-binding protein [Cyclobacteriaceae bacterium]|nr:ATP-binding protein [Cyclobacteriaceae bacterium]
MKVFRVIPLALCLFFCSLYLPASGQAGNGRRDSLLAIANRLPHDTVSFNALVNLQRFYFEKGEYDSTLVYSKKALPMAIQLNDIKNIAKSHHNLSLVYTQLLEYDSANAHLDRIDELMPQLNDTSIRIGAYNTRALLSNYRSDYATAVEALMKAAELIEASRSASVRNMLPQTYGNIGHNLIAEKQIEKGIEYEQKALLLKGYPHEGRYRVLIHLDIFDAYVKLGDLSKARPYLDSAVDGNKALNNIAVSGLVASNKGIYYQTINDIPQALAAFQEAYELSTRSGNDYFRAEAAENLAILHMKQGNPALAEKFALEGNTIGRRLSQLKVVAGTYNTLSQVMSGRNDFRKALEYSELYKMYADSATNQETQQTTVALENRYQHQKRQREIAALTSASVVRELDVVKKNRMLIGGSVLSVAIIIILALSYRNSKQRRAIAEKEQTLQQEQIRFLERQQQVVSLQSMINGQETERTRIAKDLHDGLGGLFSTVKMYFSTLQHNNPHLGKDELFQKGYSIIDTASVEVRRIAHNMMPEVLMKLGLVNALKDLCDSISSAKLLTVSLEVHGMNGRLSSTTEIMLFRIVQELLNNIIKHANATEVIIQCVRDQSRLSLIVEDNGQGFNTADAEAQTHAGIATVKNRVDYLKGSMTIDSQKNVGTTVMMDFLINEGQ